MKKKTFRKKRLKGGCWSKKTMKRGGGRKNKRTRKIRKRKQRKQKGGSNIIEEIKSFNTSISFFMILYYLHKSDNNAELINTTVFDTYKNFINTEISSDVKKFHTYLISSPSEFFFKYNDKLKFYKLSINGKFNMMNNPKTKFSFNNCHAIVGYNENVKLSINNLSSYNHYLNPKDPPKIRTGGKGTFGQRSSQFVYPSIKLNNLTQDNIEQLESKSGGGWANKANKFGRNIRKISTNIAQSYRKSDISHSTESSLISKKFEYLNLHSQQLSYIILESTSQNIDSYELESKQTIICPLDVLVGWDEGCHVGICRTRNWNGENKLQKTDIGNGFEGTQRDYELYEKTEINYYKTLNEYDDKDTKYHKDEIIEFKNKNEKIVEDLGSDFNKIGVQTIDAENFTYKDEEGDCLF